MSYKLFTSKQKFCLPDFHDPISRCITNMSALMPFNKKKDTSVGEFEHTVKDSSEGYSSGTEIDMDKW